MFRERGAHDEALDDFTLAIRCAPMHAGLYVERAQSDRVYFSLILPCYLRLPLSTSQPGQDVRRRDLFRPGFCEIGHSA